MSDLSVLSLWQLTRTYYSLTDHKALSTEAFVNMPVEEEEIKKVKKKVRPPFYDNPPKFES